MSGDVVRWQGIVTIRKIPDEWTEDDFRCMWLPREVYPLGHPKAGQVKIPPRMSEEEKEGLTVARARNTLLINGMNTLISYIVDQSTTSPGVLFQYWAVGNGAISGVDPGNTSLSGEFFRKAITGIVNTGSQATISTALGTADATGTWTCSALFGISATGTANSGTMISEVLYLPNFVKGSVAYTVDYSVSLISN